MSLRTLAATAAVAAAGSALLAAPALAGGGADVDRSTTVHVYDDEQFPGSATARVHSVQTADGRTAVSLTVTGLTPGRTYGAHAHVGPCDPEEPMVAGGHWQRSSTGGVDAQNEIWLDVTTNASGNGRSKAVQDHVFSGDHRPRSVIIHAKPTDPVTGAAGARLACIPVQF